MHKLRADIMLLDGGLDPLGILISEGDPGTNSP